MSRVRREWCAMLAKLVAPMEPETAARAFADMLPMLPPDEALYTRQTLDAVATCDRRTAVPTYADISRVLGEASKARLPASVRMGYTPPAWPALGSDAGSPSQAERDAACARSQAVKAELRVMGTVARGGDEKPQPRHLTPLQLAQAYRAAGKPLRTGLRAALDGREGGHESA